MLRSLLGGGDFRTTLAMLLLEIPVVLFSLSFHEFAHGYAAYRCGDSTAKAYGRLTLNPLKHLDPIGAVCMFLTGYGWAKPVPVNSRYFKKPRRDMLLVAAAGPLSNLALAIAFALLGALVVVINYFFTFSSAWVLYLFTEIGVLLNLSLAVFNLVPLPPLDGSRILTCLLPHRLAARYLQIERYSRYILMGFIALSYLSPRVTDILLLPVSFPVEKLYGLLTDGVMKLVGLFL